MKGVISEDKSWILATLNSIGDAVITTDKLGKITFMNPVAEKLTGWGRVESIGLPLNKVFHIINEQTRRVVENPVTKLLSKGAIIGLANHTVLISKNKKEIPIDDSGSPIKDENGNITGVVLIFRDVTERRKTDSELQQYKTHLEELVESRTEELNNIFNLSLDMICIAGFDSYFKRLNPAFSKTLGYSDEELLSKPFLEFVHPDDKASTLAEVEKIASGVDTLEFTNRYRCKDGSYKWLMWTAKPVIEMEIMYAVGHDLTERKKTEEELLKYRDHLEDLVEERTTRANFYKDLFAHDINNILQNIIGSVEMGLHYMNQPESLEIAKDRLKIIAKQVKRGAILVSNVQKLSALDRTQVLLQPTSILGILNRAIKSVKEGNSEKDLEIHLDAPEGDLSIMGNELLLDVFENILGNAVQYNEHSRKEIDIKIIRNQKDGENYIKMEFKDNGGGIEDQRKKLIFKRGHNETKSVHGMGLGLSLVGQIIASFNGQIWVEDKIKGDFSKGSNFVIVIQEVE